MNMENENFEQIDQLFRITGGTLGISGLTYDRFKTLSDEQKKEVEDRLQLLYKAVTDGPNLKESELEVLRGILTSSSTLIGTFEDVVNSNKDIKIDDLFEKDVNENNQNSENNNENTEYTASEKAELDELYKNLFEFLGSKCNPALKNFKYENYCDLIKDRQIDDFKRQVSYYMGIYSGKIQKPEDKEALAEYREFASMIDEFNKKTKGRHNIKTASDFFKYGKEVGNPNSTLDPKKEIKEEKRKTKETSTPTETPVEEEKKEEKKDNSAKKDDDASVKEEETAEAELKKGKKEYVPTKFGNFTRRKVRKLATAAKCLGVTAAALVLTAFAGSVFPIVGLNAVMNTVLLASLGVDALITLNEIKEAKIGKIFSLNTLKQISIPISKQFAKLKAKFQKRKADKSKGKATKDKGQTTTSENLNKGGNTEEFSETMEKMENGEIEALEPKDLTEKPKTEESETTQEEPKFGNDSEEPETPYETSDSESISEATSEIPEEPVAEPIENTPVPEWKKLRSREIDEQLSSLNNNGGYTGNYDETEIERRNIVEEELKKINRQLAELSNDGGYTGNYDETEIERQQLLERKRKLESFVNGGLNAPIMQKTVIDDVRTRQHINNHEQINKPVEQAPEVSEAMPTPKETQVENINVQEPTSMRYHDIYKGMNRNQLRENSKTAEELIAMAVQKINDPTTSEADKQELIGYINELRYEQGIIDERDNALGDSENLGRGRR